MNFDQCGSFLLVHIFYMKSAILGSHSSDRDFPTRSMSGVLETEGKRFTCDQVPHLSY